MSLKAKLEAVIYAAEEPVTLAQLSALFAADALQWNAEQDAASASKAEAQPRTRSEPLPSMNAEFDYREPEQPSQAGPAEPANAADEDSAAVSAAEAARKAAAESTVEAAAEAAAQPSAEVAAEAARLARLRDREVRAILRRLLDELIATYASDDRGIEIKEIAGGYRMATKPECHDAARLFVKSMKPALKLSLPALETLAVIAYKQPVTAPEVNEIRGVDSSAVFGSLLARKLIVTAGRKQVIGRPILYKTTREFLLRFGLKDVSELPSMEEFEKMAELEFEESEAGRDGEPGSAATGDPRADIDEDLDEPMGEPAANPMQGTQEGNETAAMADCDESSANQPAETREPFASPTAIEVGPTPAEAAPAAPHPPEQAEIETVPHD